MTQQVLSMQTSACSVRSDATGWGCDDSSLLDPRGVSYTKAPRFRYTYPTVLHALADGWKLLSSPEDETWTNCEGKVIPQWGWWLVRDSDIVEMATHANDQIVATIAEKRLEAYTTTTVDAYQRGRFSAFTEVLRILAPRVTPEDFATVAELVEAVKEME